MPRPRFHKLPVERQQEIIVAAGKALGKSGYEGASLNRILEQAGMSKGAAYYYFDSKDDLVATVFRALWDRLMTAQVLDPNALTADNFWDQLRDITRRWLVSVSEEPWIVSAVKAIWGLPPGARAAGPLADAFNAVVEWFAVLLRRGRDLGQVRDDLPEGLLLAVVVAMDEASDRWMSEHWDELDPATLDRYSELSLDMFKRVLVPANRGSDGPIHG